MRVGVGYSCLVKVGVSLFVFVFFFYLKENYITMSLFHDYLFLRVSNTQWYPIQDSCMTDPH